MVYKNINEVKVTRKELDKLNKLFDIDFEDTDDYGNYTQQDLIDELGACEDDCFGLWNFIFENDTMISISMCSGSSNYYDNCSFCSKCGDGWYEEYALDCDYLFDEVIEFEVDEDIYICKLTIVEG